MEGERKMELDLRKLQILKMIIDDYIMTAAPVGSRTISKQSGLNLSSATIRNEMSDLEEMGYLDQPHTSAGRVPSAKAYRLYVDKLMKSGQLTPQDVELIHNHANKQMSEVREIIGQTAKVLSEVTEYPSFVLAPTSQETLIKHVQLIPITTGRALVVIVNDAGATHQKMMRVPAECTVAQLEEFSRMLTYSLKNCSLLQAMDALTQKMQNEDHEYRLLMNSLIQAMNQQRHQEMDESLIAVGGATKIWKHPEFSDMVRAKNMLSILETKESLIEMLEQNPQDGLVVTIGPENQLLSIQDSSVITATYRIGDEIVGSMGIIGPTRMNYARVIAALHSMSDSLGDFFSQMFFEE